MKLKEDFSAWCLESAALKDEAKPWFESVQLARRPLVSINRLRSGHTSLKASLSKLNIVSSSRCPCDMDEETPDHIFWICPRFVSQRKKLRKALQKVSKSYPDNVETLLNRIDNVANTTDGTRCLRRSETFGKTPQPRSRPFSY
ncbi:Protein of unknown function [Cotesia congregata]|uniref:Uncharacterized protein n=1 Tax=Cotesia congregata TaxID=51543 RepID=A0A8J2HHE0_COTCN|nr:Protein of unknown function [Cotesia congregata]